MEGGSLCVCVCVCLWQGGGGGGLYGELFISSTFPIPTPFLAHAWITDTAGASLKPFW